MNKITTGYIIVIVLLVITSFFSLNLFFRQRTDSDKLDIRTFPHTVGNWKGKDLDVTEKEYKILETRNLISREYANPAGEKIYLFVIYSETNRSVFHPPEVCFIGSGITIADKQCESIDMGKNEFLANKLYLEKGDTKHIALYCYKSGNLYTDSYYMQQIHFAVNQLLGKGRGGATIRVSMLMRKSEEETLSFLKSFLKDVIRKSEKLQVES